MFVFTDDVLVVANSSKPENFTPVHEYEYEQDSNHSQQQDLPPNKFIGHVGDKIEVALKVLDKRMNNVNNNVEMLKKKFDLLSVNGNYVNQRLINFEAGVNEKLDNLEEGIQRRIDSLERGMRQEMNFSRNYSAITSLPFNESTALVCNQTVSNWRNATFHEQYDIIVTMLKNRLISLWNLLYEW